MPSRIASCLLCSINLPDELSPSYSWLNFVPGRATLSCTKLRSLHSLGVNGCTSYIPLLPQPRSSHRDPSSQLPLLFYFRDSQCNQQRVNKYRRCKRHQTNRQKNYTRVYHEHVNSSQESFQKHPMGNVQIHFEGWNPETTHLQVRKLRLRLLKKNQDPTMFVLTIYSACSHCLSHSLANKMHAILCAP